MDEKNPKRVKESLEANVKESATIKVINAVFLKYLTHQNQSL
jgi:hypothetical protein